MAQPYYIQDSGWYYYAKETEFRTNAQGKDTAHLDSDTVYPIPLLLEEGYAWIRQRKDFKRVWTAGSHYMSHVSMVGYKDLIIKFSGPVLTHDMFMYFGTDICDTSDDDPGASLYTHQCDSADTYPASPPTFQMVRVMTNNTGAESEVEQFCGCTVVEYDEKADANGQLIGSLTIHAALVITGEVPTTRPARSSLRAFTLSDGVLTWNSNLGILRGWSFNYKTDKKLIRGAGDYYPIIVALPNKREIYCEIKWIPYETDTYDESQDDPHSAGNKDLVMKFSRHTTNDYWRITVNDYFQDMLEDPDFEDGLINEIHRIEVNPHDTGSNWDFTEVNALTDDRYET